MQNKEFDRWLASIYVTELGKRHFGVLFVLHLPVFECRLFIYFACFSVGNKIWCQIAAISLPTTLLDFKHEGPLFFYLICFFFCCLFAYLHLETFLISQAYESISDGLGKSASALVRTPLKRYQRGDGAGSAFVSAIQATPEAAIAPAAAAARALHCALLGVRNRLGPASVCVCSWCIFSKSSELTWIMVLYFQSWSCAQGGVY